MKRIISIFLILCLTICLYPVAVYAAEPQINVSDGMTFPGEQIVLEISIENNPGISAMYLDVTYDAPLELKKVTDTGLFGNPLFSENIDAYPYRLSWDESLMTKNNTSDGVAARLIFFVPENTPVGEYNVNISCDSEEVYDNELVNVGFSLSGGCISVKEAQYHSVKFFGDSVFIIPGRRVVDILSEMPTGTQITDRNIPAELSRNIESGYVLERIDGEKYNCIIIGDTDCDGNITSSDARLTLRNSVGLEDFSPMQKMCADTDHSGIVDSSDARSILRASVGLDSALEWFQNVNVTLFCSPAFLAQSRILSDSELEKFAEAGAYVKEQLKMQRKVVDVSRFNIPMNKAEGFVVEYIHNVPSLFFVDNPINVSYSGNYLKQLYFSFIPDAAEKCKEYDAEISRLVSLTAHIDDKLEKALFYHDYMAIHYSYDTDLQIYDAYNLVTQKKGVCQAYAHLYIELMEQVGIAAKYVTSDSMVHGWNMIRLGDSWYHVDVTWDDPVYDQYGMANHDNFLLSDKAIAATGHSDWEFSGEAIKCTDTTYDNYFWCEVQTPFVKFDNDWYYIGEHGSSYALKKTDLSDEGEAVAELPYKWSASFFNTWIGYFSGLGVYNGLIVFNTPDKIKGYDPHTGNIIQLFSVSSSKSIYGILVDNGIYYNLASSPESGKQSIYKAEVIFLGDMNSDGRINAKDHTLLLRYVSSVNCVVTKDAADINEDGIHDINDASALRYYLVNGYMPAA